jgi:hypothetical protein
MAGYLWRGRRTLAALNEQIIKERKPPPLALRKAASPSPHGTVERYWHELRWEHGACMACRRARKGA